MVKMEKFSVSNRLLLRDNLHYSNYGSGFYISEVRIGPNHPGPAGSISATLPITVPYYDMISAGQTERYKQKILPYMTILVGWRTLKPAAASDTSGFASLISFGLSTPLCLKHNMIVSTMVAQITVRTRGMN